jgi:hypothetical protein
MKVNYCYSGSLCGLLNDQNLQKFGAFTAIKKIFSNFFRIFFHIFFGVFSLPFSGKYGCFGSEKTISVSSIPRFNNFFRFALTPCSSTKACILHTTFAYTTNTLTFEL